MPLFKQTFYFPKLLLKSVLNFNVFSATADGPVELMITQKFCQVGVCLSKVGISHLTTHDQDGNYVSRYTLFHF